MNPSWLRRCHRLHWSRSVIRGRRTGDNGPGQPFYRAAGGTASGASGRWCPRWAIAGEKGGERHTSKRECW